MTSPSPENSVALRPPRAGNAVVKQVFKSYQMPGIQREFAAYIALQNPPKGVKEKIAGTRYLQKKETMTRKERLKPCKLDLDAKVTNARKIGAALERDQGVLRLFVNDRTAERGRDCDLCRFAFC